MTDYAALLVSMYNERSNSFAVSSADNATLKTLYDGLFSGELCSQVSCGSDSGYDISPEMPDYLFELSALNRRVPKSELEEHPDSLFYKEATNEQCSSGSWKGSAICLSNSNGDWVLGASLNLSLHSGGKK